MGKIYTCAYLYFQNHLGLMPETLHKAVAMTDLFLDRRPVVLARVQLLGITALLVASKVEERFAPSVSYLTLY